MRPSAAHPIRIARPSSDLRAAERFWVDGLGLEVLYRAEPSEPGEHSLLMVGWPDASWHLELVGDDGTTVAPQPTDEDLLVLYLGEPVEVAVVDRLVAAGGLRVASSNPYWDQWGVTVADPDGYRLVLCERTWG